MLPCEIKDGSGRNLDADVRGPDHGGRLCVGDREVIPALDRGLLNRAIPRGPWEGTGGKGRGRQELESVATAPRPWGGWVWGVRAPCPLFFSSPLLSPPFPPVSLMQVRSSLGTNILSAMAAFAGTAILLMDFGVTNWVRFQTPSAARRRGEW